MNMIFCMELTAVFLFYQLISLEGVS